MLIILLDSNRSGIKPGALQCGDDVQPDPRRRRPRRRETRQSDHAHIRRTLVTVAARVATSARRITLHLPTGRPWQDPWTQLFTHACGPPATPT
jgi:hypothetical protein